MTGIPFDDLPPEMQDEIFPPKKYQDSDVHKKAVALGRVLSAFKGLTTREALWCLKAAAAVVRRTTHAEFIKKANGNGHKEPKE